MLGYQPIIVALAWTVSFCYALLPHATANATRQLHLERGIDYIEMELYDQALAELQKVIQHHPSYGPAHFYLGAAYRYKDMLNAAAASYQRVLNLETEKQMRAIAHLCLGIIYQPQGQLVLAEEHGRTAVAQLPEVAETHARLGDIYLQGGKLDQALAAYQQALQLNPEPAEPYHGLGRIALMQNQAETAVQYFQSAIDRDAFTPSYHYNLATAYRHLRNLKSAKQQMEHFQRVKAYLDTVQKQRRASGDKPNDMDLYLELATTPSKVGNFTAAIRVSQIAVARQPSLAEGYRGLGEVYIRQRDWKNAILAYTKLTEIHPQDAPAWERLGRIYINAKKFEAAVSAWKIAIVSSSNSANAHNNLARLYAGLEQNLEPAVRLAQKAVALQASAKHFDTLAYVYYKNRQYYPALTAIQQALEIEPNNQQYQKQLAAIQSNILVGKE